MAKHEILEGLPIGDAPQQIPSRPQDKVVTMMTFITTNKLGHESEHKRVFIGRMDTQEEVKQYADTQFSDFVTTICLKTIQFYTLETATDPYQSIR